MKLHTVFITHNRLHLTKRAIESYLETVTVPFSLIVVDNNSTDGTIDWLQDEFPFGCWKRSADGKQQCYLELLGENVYPGRATNSGWLEAPADATHLHRADNDFIFLPGWCDEVERMFQETKLGQLGMRTDEEELFAPSNVGGNNIIRRELWDKGLRYDERPWPEIRKRNPGCSEDTYFSPAVRKMGYRWDRVTRPCIVNIDEKDRDDEYYIQSFADRGIDIKLWT